MKIYILIISLLLSSSVLSVEKASLVGEWEEYLISIEPTYRYLKFNEDSSGVFTTIKGLNEPVTSHFKANQVSIDDNKVTITFGSGDSSSKAELIISSYDFHTSIGSRIATGVFYIYEQTDQGRELVNTMFVRMLEVESKAFHDHVDEYFSAMEAAEQ